MKLSKFIELNVGTSCPLAFALCILSSLAAVSASSEEVQESHRIKANLLQSPMFRIRAKLDVWDIGSSSLSGHVELMETYSVAHERSVIELKLPTDSGIPDRKYYINGTSKQVVMVDLASKSCEEIDRDEMLADILSYMSIGAREHFLPLWLKSLDGVPDYMIGLARMLQYVDQNRDSWKMTIIQNVRERMANRYTFRSPFGKSDILSASVAQYPLLTWNEAELPMRIWVKSDVFGLIMMEYFSIEPLVSYSPAEDANYYLYPTTVEPGLRCLAPAKHELMMPYREVYSMTADVIDVLDDDISPRRYFLAYDGKQQAFRRDLLNEDGSPSSLTIFDLQRQRKFNIIHPKPQLGRAGLDSTTAARAYLGDKDEKNQGPGVIKALVSKVDCVAGVSTGERAELFSIPSNEFVHLGLGVVRGIEVDIYERYSFQQPYLFFPTLSFLNHLGEWQRLTDTLNVMNTKFGQQYSTIYYFARTPPANESKQPRPSDDQLMTFGQLIRVDLMLDGRLVKTINVYDFLWQLAHGPNGDRPETLFSVPSVCFRDGEIRRPALSRQISMALQLDFSESTLPHVIKEADSMMLLDNPITRYKALARALPGQTSEISSSRILDVSSSLTKFDKQAFQVHASVKLSLAEGDAWQPHWVGTYVQLWPYREPVDGPTTFEECFFEAVRQRRGEETLFAFIRDECHIDTAPVYEFKTDEHGTKVIEFTYSAVFRIQRLVPSQHMAMRIERVRAPSRTLKARQIQSKIYENLINKHVILPVVDTLHPKWFGESLVFQVKKLEFASVREENDGPEDPVLSLNGLALLTGHEIEKKSSDDGGDGNEGAMSFDTCRAACTMDLSCRSYSVCSRGLETTCRTSELDFEDTNLISEFLKRARTTSGESNRRLSFEFLPMEAKQQDSNSDDKAKDDQEPEPKQESKRVDLEVDKRCQIYKKRALDMFAELPRSPALLKSRAILQVDSEEECAKHCLDRNIEFFSKNSNAGLHDLKTTNSTEIKKQHRNRLGSWCAMFKYLNLKTSTDGRKLLETKQLVGQEKNAICMLSRPRGASLKVKTPASTANDQPQVKAEMDTFEFEYVNLYEAHENVWMQAHHEDKDHEGQNPNRYKVDEFSTPEACARACFTQTIELKPYCKSFEFAQVKFPAGATSESMGEGKYKLKTMCTFNTLSLYDARQMGLYDNIVSSSNNAMVKVTFYEPRQAYMISDSIMKRLVEPEPLESPVDSKSHSKMVGPIVVFILALFSGIALGIWAKDPLVNFWTNEQNSDDLFPRQKFSNNAAENNDDEDGENL